VPTSVVMGRVYGCGRHLAAAVRALPDEDITERFRCLILCHRPGESSRSEHQLSRTAWTATAEAPASGAWGELHPSGPRPRIGRDRPLAVQQIEDDPKTETLTPASSPRSCASSRRTSTCPAASCPCWIRSNASKLAFPHDELAVDRSPPRNSRAKFPRPWPSTTLAPARRSGLPSTEVRTSRPVSSRMRGRRPRLDGPGAGVTHQPSCLQLPHFCGLLGLCVPSAPSRAGARHRDFVLVMEKVERSGAKGVTRPHEGR
jgi:hypothetical protein